MKKFLVLCDCELNVILGGVFYVYSVCGVWNNYKSVVGFVDWVISVV